MPFQPKRGHGIVDRDEILGGLEYGGKPCSRSGRKAVGLRLHGTACLTFFALYATYDMLSIPNGNGGVHSDSTSRMHCISFLAPFC
jgi:hypothetical protein